MQQLRIKAGSLHPTGFQLHKKGELTLQISSLLCLGPPLNSAEKINSMPERLA